MILVIDNYDSFTFNLVQYLGELNQVPAVFRNDKITISAIEQLAPTHIIISPGPGTPLQAGISNDVVSFFTGMIPVLGVCLGHQCVGYSFGASIVKAPVPVHGKTVQVYHDSKSIYRNFPNPFVAGRYHSLVVDADTLPPELIISAHDGAGLVMGLRHRKHTIEGVQFHPESIMTPGGRQIVKNFVDITAPVWEKEISHG